MPNSIKKTFGGVSFRVLTESAKAEIAAAEAAKAKPAAAPKSKSDAAEVAAIFAETDIPEPVQGKEAAKAAPSAKTKGRTSRKTTPAAVEETTDEPEETAADD